MATLVSLELIPQVSSIALGRTEKFTVLGHYDDGTRQDLTATATWVSSVTSVATIAATGVATSVALGTTKITATSGTLSVSAPLTIVNSHHTHLNPPIIMNTPLGHLKFRPSFVYDTPQVAPGPDPYTGHISYSDANEVQGQGQTVIIQPKPLDALQNVIEVRADVPAPRFWWGQEGLLIKDPAYPIKPIVESPTSSDSTAGIWRRGKYFAGHIKF